MLQPHPLFLRLALRIYGRDRALHLAFLFTAVGASLPFFALVLDAPPAPISPVAIALMGGMLIMAPFAAIYFPYWVRTGAPTGLPLDAQPPHHVQPAAHATAHALGPVAPLVQTALWHMVAMCPSSGPQPQVCIHLYGAGCHVATDPTHPGLAYLPIPWIGEQTRIILAHALWQDGGWRAVMALFTQSYTFVVPSTPPSAHATLAARKAGLLPTHRPTLR